MDFIASLPRVGRNKDRFILDEICHQLRDHVMKNPASDEWGIIDDYSDTLVTRRNKDGELMTDKEYERFYASLKKRSSRLQIEANRTYGPNKFEYRLRNGIVYGRYIGPRPATNKDDRRVEPTPEPPSHLDTPNPVTITTGKPRKSTAGKPTGNETVAPATTPKREPETNEETINPRPPSVGGRPPGW